METSIDLERLGQVLTDHPWLAEALSNGAWWSTPGGGIRVVPPLEDPLELRAGLSALAEVLGCEQDDLAIAGTTSDAVTVRPSARGGAIAARRVGTT